MKKFVMFLGAFFTLMVSATAQMIPVVNWYHAEERDWVTISNNSPNQSQLQSWGYTLPTPVYQGSASRMNGMIAIYRWYHPTEKDWVTLPENYATDETLISWGYKDKLFLFYAYPTQQPGTIRVNLWYHPTEKDYVSLPADYGTDESLIQSGYTKNDNGVFYAFWRNDGVTVYPQINFQGTPQEFHAEGIGVLNFIGRSIRINPNYYVEFPQTDCSGVQLEHADKAAIAIPIRCQGAFKIFRINTSNAELMFSIITGSDDLRRNSNAIATIELASGTMLTAPLNNGENWQDRSRKIVRYTLPTGTKPTDVRSIRIDFAGGSTGTPFEEADKWKIYSVRVSYLSQNVSGLQIACGRANNDGRDPFIELTSNNNQVIIPITNGYCGQ